MYISTKFIATLLCPGFVLLGSIVFAQDVPNSAWDLSRIPALKESAPRTYRFSIDYDNADTLGVITQRQRVTADYTRGLPNDEVVWNNVAIATSPGADSPFPAPQKSSFMEGFHYESSNAGFTHDFFKSFPAAAFMERNLVWDTGMFEHLGRNYLSKLQLNVPYHSASNQDVGLDGKGSFLNHDVILEWIGIDRRNGQDCALIEYRAFFNTIDANAGGMVLKGRSDYWGQIWVSFATRQVEYATLYEEVIGQLKLPGQETMSPLHVFRIGSFAPVSSQQP